MRFETPASVSAGSLNCEVRTGRKLERYKRRWYRRNADLVNLRPKFNSAERDILSAWT